MTNGYVFFTFLRFFWKIQKNMTFTFFWHVAHIFSNTAYP